MCIRDRRKPTPRRLRASGPAQCAIAPFDGGCVSAGEDGVVCVWDAERLVAERRPHRDAELSPSEPTRGKPRVADGSGKGGEVGEDGEGSEGGSRGKGKAPPSEADGGSRGGPPSAITSLDLWAGDEVRLVTGHKSGQVCWWA